MNLSYSTKLYPCFVISQRGERKREREKENRKAGKIGDEGDRETILLEIAK